MRKLSGEAHMRRSERRYAVMLALSGLALSGCHVAINEALNLVGSEVRHIVERSQPTAPQDDQRSE
jgi:hypothetical protein